MPCFHYRVLIEDVTKEDNDNRHNGLHFALDQNDRTVASEEDPGGGSPTGYLVFLHRFQSLYKDAFSHVQHTLLQPWLLLLQSIAV